MDGLLTVALNIFLLMLIGGIVENIIPENKFASLIKPAISLAIILTVIVYIKNFNFDNAYNFDVESYDINTQDVWDKQAENCEAILEEKILEDCLLYNINIDAIDISVKYDSNRFKIEQVKITGKEKISAKNYISGKYNIGLAYINTGGD